MKFKNADSSLEQITGLGKQNNLLSFAQKYSG